MLSGAVARSPGPMTATAPALLACAVFVAGMLHAAVTDLRHRRIRNWMVGALAACWVPTALAVGLAPGEMAAALGAGLLVFAAGLGCFAAGWLGGGDVKLAAVAVLWLGAGQLAAFLLMAALVGGVLTLLLLLIRRLRGASFASGADGDAAVVPYGPALAIAGVALLQGSPIAAAL